MYRLHRGSAGASGRATAGLSPATAREGAPRLGAPGGGTAEAGSGVSGSRFRCCGAPELLDSAVPRAQLHSEAGAPTVQCGQARCHLCHVRLNKSIRTSPAPTLCWEAVTGEHRAHRHRTASPPGWQPHTPTGRTHLA